MFDFLFENKEGKIESLLSVITTDINEIEIAKTAIEKGVNMIANAISKSEIVVLQNNKETFQEAYYILNIQPNVNEVGTDFWNNVARKMIYEGECKVCRIGKCLYIIESCVESQEVMLERTYSSIQISCAGATMPLNKVMSSQDVLIFKYKNKDLLEYSQSVCKKMNSIVNAYASMIKLVNTPKLKLKVNTSVSFVDKDSKKVLTIDEYMEKIKSLLSSDSMALIKEPIGTELEQIKMESKAGSNDFASMNKEINQAAARALHIPDAVFFGTITEKSDASNEFITYAVSPITECINDVINAKLVGKVFYLAGDRAYITLSGFKHVDLIDAAPSLDKLRGIGYNLDEIRRGTGSYALNTEFSTKRALTLNYAEEGAKENEVK